MSSKATSEPGIVVRAGLERTSLGRAVNEVGGWFVAESSPEVCVPGLAQLRPRAMKLSGKMGPGIEFLVEHADLEFLELGFVPDDLAPLGELRCLRGLVFDAGWTGDVPLDRLGALRWFRMAEPPRGRARERLYERECNSVRVLSVVGYPFADLVPLARAFPALEHLSIGRSPKLESLEGIGALAGSLRGLELFYDSKLAGLGPLRQLQVLEALDMESVRAATDLEPLRAVESLRYLQIEVPALPSLHPLDGHPGLEVLVTYARIGDRDPAPLDTMPSLRAYSGWLWKLMPKESALLANAGNSSPLIQAAVRAWNG